MNWRMTETNNAVKHPSKKNIKTPWYCWAGAFAVTKDGLFYIGTIAERPNTYFALGFGGNGITFSVIAAEILRDLIRGKKNENTLLFDLTDKCMKRATTRPHFQLVAIICFMCRSLQYWENIPFWLRP